MGSDIDVKPLEQLIKQYEYGKHHIKSENIEVIYNPINDTLSITNFYAFGKYLRTGTCVELMNTACMETKILYPDYYVLRAGGTEPRYFFNPTARHFFLVLSDKKLLTERLEINNPNLKKTLHEIDPYIVDPSFGYIGKYSQSGYGIEILFNELYPQKTNNTLTLKDSYKYTPISHTAEDQMIYISMSPKYTETFLVTIQPKGTNRICTLPIDDVSLYHKIKDVKTLQLLEILMNKQKRVALIPEEEKTVFYG